MIRTYIRPVEISETGIILNPEPDEIELDGVVSVRKEEQ